jgi:non-heme chloroperoxidase
MTVLRKLVVAGVAASGVAAAAVVAEKVAARRLRHRTDAEIDPLLDLPTDVVHRVLDTVDGGQIHLVERGEGRPLVLLHGILLSAGVWAPQLHDLAGGPERPGFRVIACDVRGHGESRAGRDGYGIPTLGRDLASVLEQLDLRDAIVAGHSMGGMAVMQFCADHPDVLRDRVAGLGFIATTASIGLPTFALERLKLLGGRVVERLDEGRISHRRVNSDDLTLMLTRLAFGRQPSGAAVARVRDCVVAMEDESFQRSGIGLLEHDVRDHLAAVRVPAVVVCGSRDMITPVGASKQLAHLLPNATLHVLPDAGHQVMQERPTELAAILREFEQDIVAADATGAAGAKAVS